MQTAKGIAILFLVIVGPIVVVHTPILLAATYVLLVYAAIRYPSARFTHRDYHPGIPRRTRFKRPKLAPCSTASS